jgi:hypothetical protein
VNQKGVVLERLLGVEHVADTKSLSLKISLDAMFFQHNLSMSRLRGQGYDGASNMRGELNGLKKLVLDVNPHAFYVHCFAHQLQLVVVAVVKGVLAIGDFFGHTNKIVTMVSDTKSLSLKIILDVCKTVIHILIYILPLHNIFCRRVPLVERKMTCCRNIMTKWYHNWRMGILCQEVVNIKRQA